MKYDSKKIREEHKLSLAKFAVKLGITKDRVHSWERNNGPTKHEDILLLEKFLGVKSSGYSSTVAEPMTPYGEDTSKKTPVIDSNFAGDFSLQIAKGQIVPVAQLSIPETAGCDYVIRAASDTMEPKISSGDWIGIKKISVTDTIPYGHTFAICKKDIGLLSQIKKPLSPNKLNLHHANKDYDNYELPTSEVVELYMVLCIIPFSQTKTFA
jgi:transcriptional regulator with XRE-family HTH domain